MDNFIDIRDYDASIHREILDALLKGDSQADPSIVEICEDRAVSEMKSYLGHFYKTDEIFAQRGVKRHPLVLMMALDIAIYHIFTIHNPYKISEIRRERYNRAVKWLEEVARGRVVIDGAPKLDTEESAAASPWQISSETKRTTYL